MIGDHRNLLRSFNIYKVFATYNMVLVHGVSMLLGFLSTSGFFEEGHSGLSFIRAAFSMTIPAFAGFYFRHTVGPFLKDHRLTLPVLPLMVPVVFGALTLELLRQLLMKGNLAYSFSWHSLHFCALSVVVSLFLMKRDVRLLPVLAVLCLATGKFLEALWPWRPLRSGELPEAGLLISGFLWAALFAVIFSFWWSRWKPRSRSTIIVFLSVFVAAFFCIKDDARALTTFANLPYSMFFLFPGDQNFWPFVNFFPLFLSGFFLRGFLFNFDYRRWFIPSVAVAVLLLAVGIASSHSLGIENSRHHTIHREAFSPTGLQVLGLAAFFYLSWIVLYYLTRNNKLSFLDRWVEWTGSVLVIYVVHTCLYALTARALSLAGYTSGSLLISYLILHFVYVFSVFLSYTISRYIPRIQGLFRERTRVSGQ